MMIATFSISTRSSSGMVASASATSTSNASTSIGSMPTTLPAIVPHRPTGAREPPCRAEGGKVRTGRARTAGPTGPLRFRSSERRDAMVFGTDVVHEGCTPEDVDTFGPTPLSILTGPGVELIEPVVATVESVIVG